MTYRQYRLDEICSPKQWKTISSKELQDTGYPVYGANGVIGFYSEFTHAEPTLLVTCRGATCGELNISEPYSYVNGNAMALDFLDIEKVKLKYLYYYLRNRGFRDVTSGSAQPQIIRANISKIVVSLPNIEIQEKVVSVLDKSIHLINKRKDQIEALDQLTQSVFLEMFGDPVINPHNYECKSIDKLCSSIYGGGTPSKSKPEYYIDGKIPWVTPKDMKSILIDSSIDYITQEAVENSSAKLIPKNSLLMVIRSGILKKNLPVAINLEEVTVNQDMKAFIFNNNVTPEYVLYFFKFYQRIILSQVRSVTADNLDFKQIKQIPVPVPTLPKQKKFTEIFYSITKEKKNLLKQLTELENVYNSINQRAFKGELFTQEKLPKAK